MFLFRFSFHPKILHTVKYNNYNRIITELTMHFVQSEHCSGDKAKISSVFSLSYFSSSFMTLSSTCCIKMCCICTPAGLPPSSMLSYQQQQHLLRRGTAPMAQVSFLTEHLCVHFYITVFNACRAVGRNHLIFILCGIMQWDKNIFCLTGWLNNSNIYLNFV